MDIVGQLMTDNGRYTFRSDTLNLRVTGDFPDWVMAAAAEMVGIVARREVDSKIDELQALVEFGEASEIEIDSVKYDAKERFEIIPQCVVTMGRTDYRWVAPEGRAKHRATFDGNAVTRVQDMSMTRHDSFLDNENGVDTSGH